MGRSSNFFEKGVEYGCDLNPEFTEREASPPVVTTLLARWKMFLKTSIEFPPKVTAALDVLFDLRSGKYDQYYDRPLQWVSIADARKKDYAYTDAVYVDHTAVKKEIVLPNPSEHLRGFSVDYCNWFKDERKGKDRETVEIFSFDGISDWYVMLWHNHSQEFFSGSRKEKIVVGITQLPKQPPKVNSYSLHLGDWKDTKGHHALLFPRGVRPSFQPPQKADDANLRLLEAAVFSSKAVH